MPVGASPQLVVTASGEHKPGAVAALAALISGQGGSIASTKKIIVQDRFALLSSVWTSSDPQRFCDAIMADAAKLEFPVTVDLVGVQERGPDAGPLARRLKLSCPQRQGLVLALTELLKDHGCAISAIDADTTTRDHEIWFELECLVSVPQEVDLGAVEADLQFWTGSQDARTSLVFDKWLKPQFGEAAV